jgi:hypothetical protein
VAKCRQKREIENEKCKKSKWVWEVFNRHLRVISTDRMSNYRSRLNVDRVPRLFADWLQCSVTRSSAHLASLKCSFLHHCHSLLALSFVSNLHFTRLRLQDLPFHIVIIISQVLFFLLSFLAVCSLLCSQTGKVSFFRNPFLRHNPCVLFCLLPFLRN